MGFAEEGPSEEPSGRLKSCWGCVSDSKIWKKGQKNEDNQFKLQDQAQALYLGLPWDGEGICLPPRRVGMWKQRAEIRITTKQTPFQHVMWGLLAVPLRDVFFLWLLHWLRDCWKAGMRPRAEAAASFGPLFPSSSAIFTHTAAPNWQISEQDPQKMDNLEQPGPLESVPAHGRGIKKFDLFQPKPLCDSRSLIPGIPQPGVQWFQNSLQVGLYPLVGGDKAGTPLPNQSITLKNISQ